MAIQPNEPIAHLAAERVIPVEELVIALDLSRSSAAPSRGTLRSALANLDTFRTGGLGYADGQWRADVPARRSSMRFPGEPQPVPVVKFPLPGVATIPRHISVPHLAGVARSTLVEAFAQITPDLIDAVPDGPSKDSRSAPEPAERRPAGQSACGVGKANHGKWPFLAGVLRCHVAWLKVRR